MSNLDRKRELIRLVQEYSEQECENLIEEARSRSDSMIRAAHGNARQHLHEAVERERARAVSRIRSAEAELHTRRRSVEQRVAESLLREGWNLLGEQLERRWNTPHGRQQWIMRCAREALDQLPVGKWTIQHPADCNRTDLDPFFTLVEKQAPKVSLEFMIESKIVAGLIIGTANTYLDMSLEGLLADRRSIEARLLALLSRSK